MLRVPQGLWEGQPVFVTTEPYLHSHSWNFSQVHFFSLFWLDKFLDILFSVWYHFLLLTSKCMFSHLFFHDLPESMLSSIKHILLGSVTAFILKWIRIQRCTLVLFWPIQLHFPIVQLTNIYIWCHQ